MTEKKATLKGSIFKDAKEKMLRKKKEKEGKEGASASSSQQRRSVTMLSTSVDDAANRRRSSTTNVVSEASLVQMRALIAQAETEVRMSWTFFLSFVS